MTFLAGLLLGFIIGVIVYAIMVEQMSRTYDLINREWKKREQEKEMINITDIAIALLCALLLIAWDIYVDKNRKADENKIINRTRRLRRDEQISNE